MPVTSKLPAGPVRPFGLVLIWAIDVFSVRGVVGDGDGLAVGADAGAEAAAETGALGEGGTEEACGCAVVVAAVAWPMRPVMISTTLIARAFRVCDSRIKETSPGSMCECRGCLGSSLIANRCG
ncbi:hypothetical protein Ait01nite_019270 [Actinoplanes italicus]|nr:hypothetical protein Ait01nite_019270 [Actinoplanes italicus]